MCSEKAHHHHQHSLQRSLQSAQETSHKGLFIPSSFYSQHQTNGTFQTAFINHIVEFLSVMCFSEGTGRVACGLRHVNKDTGACGESFVHRLFTGEVTAFLKWCSIVPPPWKSYSLFWCWVEQLSGEAAVNCNASFPTKLPKCKKKKNDEHKVVYLLQKIWHMRFAVSNLSDLWWVESAKLA